MSEYRITGVALEPHAETLGASGVEKQWPVDELKSAASSLEGQPVTAGSAQTADNVIGQVTSAEYREGEGVVYEAEIVDEEAATKLRDGMADVAPRLFHEAIGTAEIDESEDPAVAQDIEFDALFVAPAVSEGVPGVTDVSEHTPATGDDNES